MLGEREEEAERLEAERASLEAELTRGGAGGGGERGGESSHAADAERRWRAAEARGGDARARVGVADDFVVDD